MSNPLSPRATGTNVRARVAADDENMHDVLHAALCAVQRSETTKHESCSVVASATHMNILPTQPPSTHQMDSGQGGSRPADGRPPHSLSLAVLVITREDHAIDCEKVKEKQKKIMSKNETVDRRGIEPHSCLCFSFQ